MHFLVRPPYYISLAHCQALCPLAISDSHPEQFRVIFCILATSARPSQNQPAILNRAGEISNRGCLPIGKCHSLLGTSTKKKKKKNTRDSVTHPLFFPPSEHGQCSALESFAGRKNPSKSFQEQSCIFKTVGQVFGSDLMTRLCVGRGGCPEWKRRKMNSKAKNCLVSLILDGLT